MTDAPASGAGHAWAKRFGPFAPLLILLASGKWLAVLFKLKFLLSLGTFVAFYWALYGMKFGIGFAALILVHEMGHLSDIKRRGLPAEMPVFQDSAPMSAGPHWAYPLRPRAFVSLADGLFAGCVGAASLFNLLLWVKTGAAIWVALASLSAMLNVLNLIPVWVLDGGGAIAALDKTERIILTATRCGAACGPFQINLCCCWSPPARHIDSLPKTFQQPEPRRSTYYVSLLAALKAIS